MQNLPVTAIQPATSAPAPTTTDNNSTAQTAEPFGSVLARQRANAGAQQNSKQPASSAGKSAANDAPAAEPQALAADAAGTLPGDMLAALLPAAAVATNGAAADNADNKADPQVMEPDGSNSLPGDMLAMLLPGVAAANEKTPQEPITEGGKKTQPQLIAAAEPGEIRQAVVNQAASEASVISRALGASAAEAGTAEIRAQVGAKPEAAAAGVNTSKENTFTAALEALGKDDAKTAQPGFGATKISAEPTAPAVPEGMPQGGISAVAASPNGAAHVAQAVIKTPVAHEAWGNEFSQKITWMATRQEQTAALHLNPPNLGPLDVVLNVSGDQATALFTSPHAAVRDVVEQALPKLRDMLADNGITLGNAMVSDQSPKDREAWQAEQGQRGNGGAKMDANVATGDLPVGTTVSPGRRHHGMVDTFA